MLGIAILSQLAFPGEGNPNFLWEKLYPIWTIQLFKVRGRRKGGGVNTNEKAPEQMQYISQETRPSPHPWRKKKAQWSTRHDTPSPLTNKVEPKAASPCSL